MFVTPPVNDGLNGNVDPGHGDPLGPDVMLNLLDAVLGASPGSADHGTNDALVV
jgi:hypothetical protein